MGIFSHMKVALWALAVIAVKARLWCRRRISEGDASGRRANVDWLQVGVNFVAFVALALIGPHIGLFLRSVSGPFDSGIAFLRLPFMVFFVP